MGGCCAKEGDEGVSPKSGTAKSGEANSTNSERHKHNPSKRTHAADQNAASTATTKPPQPMGVTHRVEPAPASLERVSPNARDLVVPPPARRGGGSSAAPHGGQGAAVREAGEGSQIKTDWSGGLPGPRAAGGTDAGIPSAVASPATPEKQSGKESRESSPAKGQTTTLPRSLSPSRGAGAVQVTEAAATGTSAVKQSPTATASRVSGAPDQATGPELAVQGAMPPPTTAAPANALAAIIASGAAAADAQRAVAAAAAAAGDASRATDTERPKLLEFDIKFDDDDLIVVDDMDEHAEVVEDFSVDDDSPERRNAMEGERGVSDGASGPPHASTTVRPAAATSATVFDGLRMVKTTSPAADDGLRLDKKWFLDRGVVPPKCIAWSQTKRTIQIKIEPADAESGWELSKDGRVLDFTSTVGGKPIKVVLALLHPVMDLTSSLDEAKLEVTLTATKAPVQHNSGDGDSDEESDVQSPTVPYWTQLLRCSRRDYGALTFIRRELDDNEDDDDHGVPAYVYGSHPPADADGAFSEPEDD